MAFNPTSTIYVCSVPIDNTYKNQLYFPSRQAQQEYFEGLVRKPFYNYLTVRKTLADGSLQSSVKVEANIDDLYGWNYLYYQNENHGPRWFYAFITKLIYINEVTTEIVFETDVWQTWFSNITLKESFVLREHSVTDEIGDNLVPENFNVNDFKYVKVDDETTDLGQWGYLVACTEWVWTNDAMKPKPGKHSGIYQGLYFYYFTNTIHVNQLIEMLNDKGQDSIISISVIPEFAVEHAGLFWLEENELGVLVNRDDVGLVDPTDYPNEKRIFVYKSDVKTLDGHTPKNNKLWTYPYFSFVVSNNSGDTREYIVEDFWQKNIAFTMYADISANPSVVLVPEKYKGVECASSTDDVYGETIDFGLSLSGFPQCAFINDYYKLWMAKNSGANAINATAGVASAIMGAFTAVANPLVGAGMIVGGATTVANAINKHHVASITANNGTSGAPNNNLLTAMKRNKFDMRFKTLKYDQAKSLDDYFTMFGYQTNKLKVPNISSRPYYNYVQTDDCNIVGYIPDDDMKKIKSMFNNGVTLWKDATKVGDYSVDNSPT